MNDTFYGPHTRQHSGILDFPSFGRGLKLEKWQLPVLSPKKRFETESRIGRNYAQTKAHSRLSDERIRNSMCRTSI